MNLATMFVLCGESLSGEIIVLTREFYTISAEWLIYQIDFWHIRVEWRTL